jgi:hypothetical protein
MFGWGFSLGVRFGLDILWEEYKSWRGLESWKGTGQSFTTKSVPNY